jgi:hypothetical protein
LGIVDLAAEKLGVAVRRGPERASDRGEGFALARLVDDLEA